MAVETRVHTAVAPCISPYHCGEIERDGTFEPCRTETRHSHSGKQIQVLTAKAKEKQHDRHKKVTLQLTQNTVQLATVRVPKHKP